jgi:2-polyprenyl-3-methyl-5-hydroxy-6-metoxy-1,4-benzoquinol methylase
LHPKRGITRLLRFQSALALQCFTNEYIYSHTEEEEKILQSLDASVKKALKNKEQPSPQVILALASYKALNQYDWCKLLVVTDEIKDVFIRQVEEPIEEEKLKTDLPILEEITDSISSEVRAQYEESPYPRWVNLGLQLKPLPISKIADDIKLKLHDNKITEVEKPEVLIAGCGTGQHSIGTATRFKGSKVLAIDLSLSSLAYAKRKTEELAIENIEYMQADILDLGKLNKQFDIIESAGVLHHMDNPMAGWKVLTDCMKPGGLIMIGLYSELARQDIIKIRNEISNANIGSSDEEMKSFRDTIMRSEKDHHKLIMKSPDFYSLSTLRDLLFHVQEHRFTIPQIADYLDQLGLKFSGFEDFRIVSHFQKTNTNKNDPYDLDKWQSYEQVNPRSFGGMYQFWCQKAE